MSMDEERLAQAIIEADRLMECKEHGHQVEAYAVPMHSRSTKLIYECLKCERIFWGGSSISIDPPLEN